MNDGIITLYLSLVKTDTHTMLKFLRKSKKNDPKTADVEPVEAQDSKKSQELQESQKAAIVNDVLAEVPAVPTKKEGKLSLFARLKSQLKRTSSGLAGGLGNLIMGRKKLDDELLDELETRLLLADVGIDATRAVLANLVERLGRKELESADVVVNALREELEALVIPCALPLVFEATHRPTVVLVIGVNGAGKTTTIGKLAKRWQLEGRKVMLAAGDTFRAAAVEQLQVWGDRHGVPVIARHSGADSAAVAYEAYETARSQKVDVLIIDTAGRLHTKANLMDELKKMSRVLQKIDPAAPHEVLLVLDASTGQNALSQAKTFHEAMNLTGLCLTKLDGTAKGGILFAIARQLKVPIRFIGVGEQAEDLREFNGSEFVAALFDETD